MIARILPALVPALLLITATAFAEQAAAPQATPPAPPSQGGEEIEMPIDFARDVLPILQAHCIACHGPD
ncbi:MAG: hypothetical protein ACREJB_07110, partial [Planctomycetaceae bacterium]